ncbi:MAG: COR domain-containing protein [Bacteroidota bacterium]
MLNQIQHALGFELKVIQDIEAFMQNNFPQSYLEVMTPAEEMVGSMYEKTAFLDPEGNLIGLNLFDCQVSDAQIRFLQEMELPHLVSLNLIKNQLTTFQMRDNLSGLVYVQLSENPQLQRITLGDHLSKLARLEIIQTGIKRLRIPAGCQDLFFLEIVSNEKLEQLIIDAPLPRLMVALLRGNALQSFHLPAGFELLVHLYLNNNQLTEIDLQGEYPDLLTLQLRDNQLRDFPEAYLSTMPHMDGLYLGRNPLPEELAFRLDERTDQNSLHLVKAHFAQRKIGQPQPNNECKVLLIGNGKAGKTAIVNRIVHDEFDPTWDSTHGISLFRKELGEYLLNFWDFGGQDLYHATHRLFMQKNAVYLLAWSLETEESYTDHRILQSDGKEVTRRYQNYGLRYWLEYAKHLGKGSPMHVVQTKIGKDAVQDKSDICEAYEDDFRPEMQFHAVESSEANAFDNGYKDLLTSMDHSVATIKTVEETIAEPLHKLREFLRAQQKEGQQLMSFEEYEQKAIEFQVQEPREMLESWLHKSGVVYYQKGKFSDQIIRDQAWAIKAIYTLFDRSAGIPYQIEENQGAFTGAFVQDIWQEEYPDQGTHELFINFMKSCDLCFEIDTGEKHPNFRERLFMAPQLLQRSKPVTIEEDFWDREQEVLHYRYEDDFIHEGLIHSFISKTAYLAKLREIWRIGIQIKEGDQYACVEAGEFHPDGRKQINIRLTRNARPLLGKIRRLIGELQGDKGQELISKDGRTFDPLSQGELSKQFLAHEVTRQLELDEQEVEAMIGESPATQVHSAFKEDQLAKASPEEIQHILQKLAGLEGDVSDLKKGGQYLGSTPFHPDAKPILFVAADPEDTTRLRTNKEHKRLRAQYERSDSQYERYRFLDSQFAIDIGEWARAMDGEPHIIHFAGHGTQAGLFMEGEDGKKVLIGARPLRRMFKRMKGITQLVILNACYSAEQAQTISMQDMYVIGTNHKILDHASIKFSEGFYSALGRGKSFKDCFDEAILPVEVHHPSEADKFEVWYQGKILTDWME